jgi:hypothetical protein
MRRANVRSLQASFELHDQFDHSELTQPRQAEVEAAMQAGGVAEGVAP